MPVYAQRTLSGAVRTTGEERVWLPKRVCWMFAGVNRPSGNASRTIDRCLLAPREQVLV